MQPIIQPLIQPLIQPIMPIDSEITILPQSHSSIYRFKLSKTLSDELSNFANLHRYTPKKDIKECWEKWLKTATIESLVRREQEILNEKQYDGDLIKKMFTSMRYYYMKQPVQSTQSTQSNANNQESESIHETHNKKEKRIYNKKSYKLTKEDHNNIDNFLKQNNNVSRKQSIIWNEFIEAFMETFPSYGENQCIKKSFKNKIYQAKKQKNIENQIQHIQEQEQEQE